MPDRPLTLVTAGHIDHGKTSLIRALTGKDTDRLPEERRRGISIELGFAEMQLADGRSLSVVDVPGHERLVRTMVAGAGGTDLFLLVIAADDGPMPQTREHLAVLRALGVERGVIAVTRCDLADSARRAEAVAAARRLAPQTPVIEVSTRTGEGIEALKAELAKLAQARLTVPLAGDGWPEAVILHIDRVFTLRGIGTVVTGTLRSGLIQAGDRVWILPCGRPVRVRSVQVHDRSVARAAFGGRVALNLAGGWQREVSRGDAVVGPEANLAATYRLDVELNLEQGVGTLDGQRVQVHHGARDVSARVVALDHPLVQLRLESELIVSPGDRIVLRRIAPPDTLGGGRVVDARPPRHRGGAAAERARLIEEATPKILIATRLRAASDGLSADPGNWIEEPLLEAALRRFRPARWRHAISTLLAEGGAIECGKRIYDATTIEERVQADRPTVELGEDALATLELLQADGRAPRSPAAVAEVLGVSRDAAISCLEELVGVGRVRRLGLGIYFPVEQLAEIEPEALILAERESGVSIAQLRDALGTSRKYAQALLEWLDSRRLTIRRGDRHLLRRTASRS